VFGAGAISAQVMLIGEQPGNSEDRAGKPFVGPAGRLLDDALAHAGIPKDAVYVTNVVKHFKYTLRGKRRIHDKPTRYEVAACEPWLGAELDLVEPEIVVLLGASAAQALLGASFRVTQSRGRDLEPEPSRRRLAPHVFATVHPAAVLRAPDVDAREDAWARFVADFDAIGECYRTVIAPAA
jgi:DNA polymerase